MKNFSIRCAMLASILAAAPHAGASVTDDNRANLGLGDMMNNGVESALRKSQSFSNTAATVFVISAVDA